MQWYNTNIYFPFNKFAHDGGREKLAGGGARAFLIRLLFSVKGNKIVGEGLKIYSGDSTFVGVINSANYFLLYTLELPYSICRRFPNSVYLARCRN